MKLEMVRFSQEERRKRIEILTDVIISFHTHLGGKYRHSRIPELIIPNECIQIGTVEDGNKERRIEHLVPLSYLFDKCNEIVPEGRDKVVKILDRCMLVINIPKDLQEKIDKEYKVDMPSGWCLETGCVFERLKQVSFTIDNIKFNDKWDLINNTWKL